jgi:hypothetical protein
MRIYIFLIIFLALGLLLGSCNLSDFGLNKVADPSGLNPVIYRPMSSGTYVVKDYYSPLIGNTPVTLPMINFNLIQYPFNGMAFNTKGTDSMVIIVKTVNETPMKYRYKLIFTGPGFKDSTLVNSKILKAPPINAQGFVVEPSRDSLEYKLDSAGVEKLGLTTQIDLSITLYQPDNGTVLASVLKPSAISFYIGFRAPINLFKIKT